MRRTANLSARNLQDTELVDYIVDTTTKHRIKKLLRKQNDANDKRLVHLKPTAKGQRLVERTVPSASLVLGIDELSKSERQGTVEALSVLLRSVQKANSFKTFAPCHTCQFNQGREGGYLCGLTGELLTAQDVIRICREHQYP